MQFDGPVARLRRQRHFAPSVANGVVQHVAERLLEPEAVRGKDERLGLDAHVETAGQILQEIHHVRLLVLERHASLLRAREQEQILGETGQTVGALGRRHERAPQFVLRTSTSECELELRLQQRQRGPELMARVCDESALPRKAALDPSEHRVERPAEPRDLVA